MFWLWFFCGAAAVVLLGVLTVFLVGRILRYRSYTVFLPTLPPALDGYRIAVISDLHDRRFGRANRILAHKVLAASPDLVVIAGDMHEPPHDPQPFYDLIKTLASKVPVTYTEGNHDLRVASQGDYSAHLSKIASCGAVLLNDAQHPISYGNEIFLLCGQSWASVSQGRSFSADLRYFTLLVAHDPMQFDRLSTLPDLLISGHVHGGILRLPFLGPIFAPGNGAPISKRFSAKYFFPKYSRGLYYQGNKCLAVTQGLGFSVLPVRFIPPEVMVLTLKSGEILNNS